jgi:hypothetical protein
MPAIRTRAKAGRRNARHCRALVTVEVHRCRCIEGRPPRAAALADLLRRLRRTRDCPGRLLREVAALPASEAYRLDAD